MQVRRLAIALVLAVAAPLGAQEKSVNPGVNKSFEKPNVLEFVERFEKDGRDAYDRRNEVLAALGLKSGQVVADIGAGTGLFTRLFSPQVGPAGKVYAVDIAREFVTHIEKLAQREQLTNVAGVVCRADSVELPAKSLDLAFICDTYHHFEFPYKTMRSLHQALKPQGQVVLIDFHRIPGKSSDWALGHVRAGQEVFVQEIEDAGFRLIEERTELLKESYYLRFEKRAWKSPAGELLVPLPRAAWPVGDNRSTPEKVALGKQLFFDPRLSGNNRLSCASCHLPDKAFADGLPQSQGHGGKLLDRNTQSCLNVGFYASFFWDGRAATLEEQALGPIQSPVEMNQDLTELERELAAIPGYVSQFQTVFGAAPSRAGVAQALAAYQRTLVAGRSPFDRYLLGDQAALSADAQRGLELFVGEARCIECHHGPLLSDGKYHRLLAAGKDEGRAKITGKAEDRWRFRTPSLRNIAETGPYLHDGSLKTLEEVVAFYYRGIDPAGKDGLKPDAPYLGAQSLSDTGYLVAFLKSLSGPLPDVTPPALPPTAPGKE